MRSKCNQISLPDYAIIWNIIQYYYDKGTSNSKKMPYYSSSNVFQGHENYLLTQFSLNIDWMDKPGQAEQTFTKRDDWLTLDEEKSICPSDIEL